MTENESVTTPLDPFEAALTATEAPASTEEEVLVDVAVGSEDALDAIEEEVAEETAEVGMSFTLMPVMRRRSKAISLTEFNH